MQPSNNEKCKYPVWVRADAGGAIGFGHLSRSITFASNLSPRPVLLTRTPEACYAYGGLVSSAHVVAIPDTVAMADEPAWIGRRLDEGARPSIGILDHYGINAVYEAALQSQAAVLVSFDDFNTRSFAADYVLNPAGYGYSLASLAVYTEVLEGLEYSAIRSVFWGERSDSPSALITVVLGGNDATGLLSELLARLSGLPCSDACKVVAPGVTPENGTQDYHRSVQYPGRLPPEALADLFARSSLVISSASTVALEACASRVPLVAIQTADNQKLVAAALRRAGVAKVIQDDLVGLEEAVETCLDPVCGREIQQRQDSVFSDLSATSTAVRKRICDDVAMELRQAGIEDSDMYLAWANDPLVRAASFSTEKIDEHSHADWFSRKIDSPQAWLFVACMHGQNVGQIRFELSGENEILLSYSIDAAHRGRGLGRLLVRKGLKSLVYSLQKLPEYSRINFQIVAKVREGNDASARVFQGLGFRRQSDATIPEASMFTREMQVRT